MLSKEDVSLLKSNRNAHKTTILRKYNNEVFKDKDFKALGFQLDLTKIDMENLLNTLKEDTKILKDNYCTDYSLLISIHNNINNNKKEFDLNSTSNIRVLYSKDKNFAYCFSLIDFLISFDYKKYAEMKIKKFSYYIRQEDNNVSAEEPVRYADRMVDFIKTLWNGEHIDD